MKKEEEGNHAKKNMMKPGNIHFSCVIKRSSILDASTVVYL